MNSSPWTEPSVLLGGGPPARTVPAAAGKEVGRAVGGGAPGGGGDLVAAPGRRFFRAWKSHSPKKLPVNSPLSLQPAAPFSHLPPTSTFGFASRCLPSCGGLLWSLPWPVLLLPSTLLRSWSFRKSTFPPPACCSGRHRRRLDPRRLLRRRLPASDDSASGVPRFRRRSGAPPIWTTLTSPPPLPALLLSLWPVRPIRKPTPIARTSVATPAISAALAFHRLFEPPDWVGGGGGVAPPHRREPSSSTP